MKLKPIDVKPGDFIRRERSSGKVEKILSRDDKFVVAKTDCGEMYMELDEELEYMTEEEIRRHSFEPSDKERLDWLSGKVRDREITVLARDAPVAMNLRNLIDAMMIHDSRREASRNHLTPTPGHRPQRKERDDDF